jgi:LuxR family transcriptional regulator, maltose regulon positive regulatory protein
VAELEDATEVPVVLVVAGGGFGKTTLVSQWLEQDGRSLGWLTATRQHDDPAVLLDGILRRLDALEPLEPRGRRLLSSASLDFSSVLVPRLERTVAELGRPFVLVIDDAHRLRKRTTWSLVQALADSVPAGSQLVLVSRIEPPLALGRMRADRRVHAVASAALAFDRAEAGELIASAGLSLPAPVVDGLWERTEGWPVALYLASLAVADADDPVRAACEFAGDDRYVVDYMRDELLGVLPRATRDFLLRAAILDELRGPVCDAVLARDDSVRVLGEIAASFQLLIPLDRRGEAYRMHQLLRDSLRAELVRDGGKLAQELHRRAADWYEGQGELDRAIEHLRLTDDRAELERMIWRAAPVYGGSGRTATVERWLTWFSDDERSARPALAASSAWLALMAGDMSSLRRWAGVVAGLGDDVLPDGNPVAYQAALLRALIGGDGIEAMRADARLAYELDRTQSAFRSIARYIEGGALRLQGRRIDARDRLVEAEAIGAVALPATQSHCLAQLAVLAIDDDDWETARRHVDQLIGVLDRYDLRERPAQAVSLAIAGLVLARTGDRSGARVAAKQALFLVSMLSTVAPWISIETDIALARTFLLLGEVPLARTLTREGIELLQLVPDGELLRLSLAELQQSTEAEAVPAGVPASPLSPAEMRVLRYLPTHLTFGAIADELFVSRNTVKTQAISIYRKLGVVARGPAVEAARGLGLLDDEGRFTPPG